MEAIYIASQADLLNYCQQWQQAPVLAIDTEFVRTRTYYPILGLLQVCDGANVALIDPISIENLEPFWQLLANEQVVKVLHACSEDLEVFLSHSKVTPKSLIDTQVMMAFLGHGLSVGYAAMVEHYLGVMLDKSESRTDWTKRPLTAKQLSYAQADVSCLFELYPLIAKEVEQAQRLSMVQSEVERMIERKYSALDTERLYFDVKMSWRLSAAQLNRLRVLAKWRYYKAIEKNCPLSFVAKDHSLIAVAEHNPSNVGAMANIEGIDILDIRHQGKAMLQQLKQGNSQSVSDYPAVIVRIDRYPEHKQHFKLVKNIVQQVAEQFMLTVEVLASKRQINQFLSWYFRINGVDALTEQVDFLCGWRQQLFGEQLIAVLEQKYPRP